MVSLASAGPVTLIYKIFGEQVVRTDLCSFSTAYIILNKPTK